MTSALRWCFRCGDASRQATTLFALLGTHPASVPTHHAPRTTHHAPMQPEPLERVLEGLLHRLGLPSPSVSKSLDEGWDEMAGPPWSGQTRPLFIREGELVVEAISPSLVGMLRYAIGDLMRRLDEQLGEGVVETVRVVGPNQR